MDAQNAMPKREKNDVAVKLWLPESLYQSLQDLAAERDQSLSEHIRKTLEGYAFGACYKLSLARIRQNARREPTR